MASTEPRAGFRPPWAFRPDPENQSSPDGEAPAGGAPAGDAEGSIAGAEGRGPEPSTGDESVPVASGVDEAPADESAKADEPATADEPADIHPGNVEADDGDGPDDVIAFASNGEIAADGSQAIEDQAAADPWTAESEREDSVSTMNGTAADAESSESAEPYATTAGSDAEETVAEATAIESASEPEPTAEPFDPRFPGAPNKLQQDLARAMRATAESARTETLERLAADSAARIEAIRNEVSEFANELRHRADEDIAEVREWSKAEIARIRGETDQRVADRKAQLEVEIQAHEGTVQARIEAVEKRVAAFESNLDAFFERLSREDDPTRIAVMATALPEAPDLDALSVDPPAVEAPADEPAPWVVDSAEGEDAGDGSDDQESDAELLASVDRRLAAFGLDPHTAAVAEQEAGTDLPGPDTIGSEPESEPGSSIVTATEADVASRDPDRDGYVPAWSDATTHDGVAASEATETTVVVEGLISVASIAGFKRSLSRFEGVSSVTVTSGPDGEFLFAVKHDPSAAIEAGLPGLAGFGVRIVDLQAGTIRVSAHDPEQTADSTMNAAGPRL